MSENNKAPPEEFSLDLEPSDTLREHLAADVERRRARTANVVAIVLVIAVAASLPVAFLAAIGWPSEPPSLEAIFDRWITAVGPLAGLAAGFYFGRRSSENGSG